MHLATEGTKSTKCLLKFTSVNSKIHFVLLCFFVTLFGKPSIGVQEFNSDAPVAVDVVDPRAIHFGVELTTKRRHELHLRTKWDINVDEERGAAAADLNGLRLRCERCA